MELILKDYSWDMDEYALRTPQGESGQLTLKDAYMAYHLLPAPPPNTARWQPRRPYSYGSGNS